MNSKGLPDDASDIALINDFRETFWLACGWEDQPQGENTAGDGDDDALAMIHGDAQLVMLSW